MTLEARAEIIHEPDPDQPGWYRWELSDVAHFNGQVMAPLLVRREGERSARLRLLAPEKRHSNINHHIHGGVTLALVDIALFAAAYTVLGTSISGSVTLDLNCQFIGAGQIGKPLDAVSEVLRETGRLVFVRGLVEQDGTLVASYSGTIRKASASRK